MKKATKVWLITAAALVLIGCVLFAGVAALLKWDFKKLATVRYETNTHEISEAFDCISINSGTADIEFVLSEGGNCKVECLDKKNLRHSVSVEDDTLTIELIDARSGFDYVRHIRINVGSSRITVYLPKTEYASLLIRESTGYIEMPEDFSFKDVDISLSTGDVDFGASASGLLKIRTSTGQIHTQNLSAGELDLTASTGNVTVSGVSCEGDVRVHVTTGKVNLTDLACKNVITTGNTGDIFMKNVLASETFSIERSTGDVAFDACDAAEIFVTTDTGDVSGTLLSDKVFLTRTDTGDVDVPKTITGGRCEITTDTGDIRLRLA